MGTHKGWRVRKVGLRFRGMVSIPGTGEYRGRTFDDARSAEAWADMEAARIKVGMVEAVGPQPVSTADVARDYLAELVSLNRAPSTIQDLHVMFRAMAAGLPRLDLVTVASFQAWLANLTSSGKGRGGKRTALSPSRRNKVLVNARAMVRWAMRYRGLRKDPTDGVRKAYVDQKIKPQFAVAELGKLLGGKDSATRRWVALMTLAGLRSDEARRIRWQDIEEDGRVLLVLLDSGARIKRRKERIVPLQPALVAILGKRGQPGARVCTLGPGNLQRAFADYLTARELPANGRTPHSCRHTFAGLMAATGVPTGTIGSYLGDSEKTTLGYLGMAARFTQDPTVATWKRGELLVIM